MGTRSSQALPRLWLRHAPLAAAALGAGALAPLAYETGTLNGLERQTVDARFAIRGAQPPGGGVVIVGVDQRTLSAIGARPPIPRGYYAQVLDRLRAAHPRLIAIDAQFIGTTDRRDDGAPLAAIARDGPILLHVHSSPRRRAAPERSGPHHRRSWGSEAINRACGRADVPAGRASWMRQRRSRRFGGVPPAAARPRSAAPIRSAVCCSIRCRVR